ncbi:flagellar hook-associated protein FlgL [Actinoplanes sp. N902-109]|uniref:flagellar hook-associated protein FlgL n=1 Tax=Actinoplanes sp. (strain N902-109) TaxID=649831 RepID=UPI0003294968|nr:flagellar hook-associated protein FlgL [Actinoplanes sp. N902-109]AGL21196.1 flagellar hook-associated protein 3 [Actinoplanes sp. N902-109]
MAGRVTESSIHTRVLQNLQRSIQKGEKIQEQLSSGKQINRPSDSPNGTLQSMQLRGETRANNQYVRSAGDGLGWLSTLDGTLSSTSTILQKARSLTVQGLNNGGNNPEARAAISTELDQIRTTVIGYANTTYLDRPVFGGTTTGTKAFDENGEFVGNTDAVNRNVGPNSQVRVDASGTAAFGEGDSSVFKVLDDISKALTANDMDAVSKGLDRLDAASNNVKNTLSDVGARYNRITQMKQSAEDRLLDVTAQLSEVEDVDLPKTIMDMQLQQTSYQAALAASAKVIQPSLIDFLR